MTRHSKTYMSMPKGPESVREAGARLSNWGRWGAGDEKGTLNFITPERRLRALALPRVGETYTLCIDLGDSGPWNKPGGPRYNPRHTMTALGGGQNRPGGFTYTDDSLDMPLQAATQWDAIAHVFYDGKMYNGGLHADVTAAGAARNGIDKVSADIVGRGVLLDIARHLGVDCLPDELAVPPEMLDDCAAAQGVRIETGDIILVRTGLVGRGKRTGWDGFASRGAGLSVRCADWLHAYEIAALAADNIGVERFPAEMPDCHMALHMICLRDMGMMFGEIWDLEALAVRCAALGRYEFLLAAQPLPVTGGVGSVVNPIAVL